MGDRGQPGLPVIQHASRLANITLAYYIEGMNEMQPQKLRRLYGVNVRARRKELGLTQEEVADDAGVTQAYVAAIEAGKSWPRITVFARLPEILQTNPATLLSSDSAFSAT